MIRNRNIFLILLLGLLLRLFNLNQSFWLDEGAQMIMSQKPLLFQWVGRTGDVHPPLFYALIHFFLQISRQEWFLRLPSVLFGLATVYLIYLIGRELFNNKIAITSSLFLATSQFHIYYSQEARMYSLLAFLATMSMFLFWKKRWIYYYLVTALMLYTHYAGFFIILSQVSWAVFFRRKEATEYLENIFIGFLPFTLWIPQLLKQLTAGTGFLKLIPTWREVATLSPLKSIPLLFFKFSFGRISFSDKFVYGLLLILILGLFGFLGYKGLRKLDEKKLFVINWLVVPVLGMFFVSFALPMFQPPRLIFVIIPFYLIVALGISEFKNKLLSHVLLIFILIINFSAICFYYAKPEFQRENWRSAVRFVEYHDSQNSLSLFEFSDIPAPYEWYMVGKTITVPGLPRLGASDSEVNDLLSKKIDKSNIYLFQYLQPLTDPDKAIEKWLIGNKYALIHTYDFPGVGFVFEYRKPN